MCNIGIVLGDAGVKLPTAILFMNSNKSERNIRKKVAKTREKCMSHVFHVLKDNSRTHNNLPIQPAYL